MKKLTKTLSLALQACLIIGTAMTIIWILPVILPLLLNPSLDMLKELAVALWQQKVVLGLLFSYLWLIVFSVLWAYDVLDHYGGNGGP